VTEASVACTLPVRCRPGARAVARVHAGREHCRVCGVFRRGRWGRRGARYRPWVAAGQGGVEVRVEVRELSPLPGTLSLLPARGCVVSWSGTP